MSYDGPFKFINTDPEHTKNTKEQNFAVLSHVVGTHRKWSKGKRLQQLNLSSPIGPTGRVAIARRPAPPAASSNKTVDQDNALQQTSVATSTSRYVANDHGASCGCSSCLEGKRDMSLVRMRSPISLSQLLAKGNSDPVATSSLPITAKVNEYLQLGSMFYVFWSWPVHASALFRSRAHSDWKGSVVTSFRQPSEMHAMLAGGAYVRADRSPADAGRDLIRATSHKTKAMSQLRENLVDTDPKGSAVLLWTVLRLLALEVHAGNFEAAMWHHRAAKQIIRYHKFPDWHHDSQLTFFTAEVWVCTALLQKPAPMETQWGAGPLPDEPAVENPEAVSTRLEPEDAAIHGDMPLELRKIIFDIRKVQGSMQMLEKMEDEEQKFHTVTYLDTRAAVLKARLLTLWVDFNTKHRGASLSTTDITFSACSIAALIFLNFSFMFVATRSAANPFTIHSKPSSASSILHKAFLMLHRDLSQLLKMWRMSSHTVSSELILWLAFISTLADSAGLRLDLGTGRLAPLYEAIDRLEVKTPGQAKTILRKFLFDEAMMDEYLDKLIAIAPNHRDVGMRSFMFQQLDVHLRT